MPKVTQPKPCQSCQKLVYLRYRIQFDASGKWNLVCVECWQQIADDNVFYRYGGTWKAK
jgi:hypothetical protein